MHSKISDQLYRRLFCDCRYSLPFKAQEQERESPWVTRLPKKLDPGTQAMQTETLSIAWNVAWHDGIDALLADGCSGGNKDNADALVTDSRIICVITSLHGFLSQGSIQCVPLFKLYIFSVLIFCIVHLSFTLFCFMNF